MDTLFAILAVLFAIIGIVGSIVPALPGPPISYVGLILVALTSAHPFSWTYMIVFGVVMALVQLADFYLPAAMTSKFGGSPYAKRGSMVGVFAGMFIMPPLGLFLCPFLGAFIGELLWDKTTPTHQALRVAFGSFVAFLLGTGAKLIVAVWMLVDILKAII